MRFGNIRRHKGVIKIISLKIEDMKKLKIVLSMAILVFASTGVFAQQTKKSDALEVETYKGKDKRLKVTQKERLKMAKKETKRGQKAEKKGAILKNKNYRKAEKQTNRTYAKKSKTHKGNSLKKGFKGKQPKMNKHSERGLRPKQ